MVLTSLSEINQEGIVRKKIYPENFCGKEMQIDDYLMENNYSMEAPIHSITYKTSLLKDSRFRVCDRFYGDLDYIVTPLLHVKTVYLSRLNIYQYFIGREGQSVSIEGYNAHIDDYLDVCRKTVNFWINNKENFSLPLKQYILKETIQRIRWGYILLLSPRYSGNKSESKYKLKQLDYLVRADRTLYSLTNKIKVKKIIPWLYIWRRTRINLFKLFNRR